MRTHLALSILALLTATSACQPSPSEWSSSSCHIGTKSWLAAGPKPVRLAPKEDTAVIAKPMMTTPQRGRRRWKWRSEVELNPQESQVLDSVPERSFSHLGHHLLPPGPWPRQPSHTVRRPMMAVPKKMKVSTAPGILNHASRASAATHAMRVHGLA